MTKSKNSMITRNIIQLATDILLWKCTFHYYLSLDISVVVQQLSFPIMHKVGKVGIFVLLKLKITKTQFLVTSILIQNIMTNRSLHKIFFIWQLLPIYFHYKLYKNANIANFVYYGKTRLWLHTFPETVMEISLFTTTSRNVSVVKYGLVPGNHTIFGFCHDSLKFSWIQWNSFRKNSNKTTSGKVVNNNCIIMSRNYLYSQNLRE